MISSVGQAPMHIHMSALCSQVLLQTSAWGWLPAHCLLIQAAV